MWERCGTARGRGTPAAASAVTLAVAGRPPSPFTSRSPPESPLVIFGRVCYWLGEVTGPDGGDGADAVAGGAGFDGPDGPDGADAAPEELGFEGADEAGAAEGAG